MNSSQNPLCDDGKEAELCKKELCSPHIETLLTVIIVKSPEDAEVESSEEERLC